jgi:hypothetical protein
MIVLWIYGACALAALLVNLTKLITLWNIGALGVRVDGDAEGEGARRFHAAMALSTFTSAAGGAILWPLQFGAMYLARKASQERPMAIDAIVDLEEIQQFSSDEEFQAQVRTVVERLKPLIKKELLKGNEHPGAISYALSVSSWVCARYAHETRGFPVTRARETFLLAADQIAKVKD